MSKKIFLCGFEKLTEEGKEKMREYMKYLDEKEKSTKHPMFPNEDTTVTCGRHTGDSCTEAHDSHVAGLIERDSEITYLKRIIANANEEICELKCARSALIEVLEMAVEQHCEKRTLIVKPETKTLILKTECGEESEALLIPKEEVESVLQRYSEMKP